MCVARRPSARALQEPEAAQQVLSGGAGPTRRLGLGQRAGAGGWGARGADGGSGRMRGDRGGRSLICVRSWSAGSSRMLRVLGEVMVSPW